MAINLQRIALSFSESLNYYMSYLNELCEPDSHFGEIRRQPFLGSILFFPKAKKINSLCIFSKSYLHELRKPNSHFGEISRQIFLGRHYYSQN